MPTYATAADLDAYAADHGLGDETAAARALEAAERTVDGMLGPYVARPDTGLKIRPEDLPTWARAALARAVCAQAVHAHGFTAEERAAGGRRLASLVSGPDFQESYGSGATLSTTSADARDELEPVRRLLRPRVRMTS